MFKFAAVLLMFVGTLEAQYDPPAIYVDDKPVLMREVFVWGYSGKGWYNGESVSCPVLYRWRTYDGREQGFGCFHGPTGYWQLNTDMVGSRVIEPKYDLPSDRKTNGRNSPRNTGTPKVSIPKAPDHKVLRAIKLGAGRLDEALVAYRSHKRDPKSAIPCRLEAEKIIPAIILGTCLPVR